MQASGVSLPTAGRHREPKNDVRSHARSHTQLASQPQPAGPPAHSQHDEQRANHGRRPDLNGSSLVGTAGGGGQAEGSDDPALEWAIRESLRQMPSAGPLHNEEGRRAPDVAPDVHHAGSTQVSVSAGRATRDSRLSGLAMVGGGGGGQKKKKLSKGEEQRQREEAAKTNSATQRARAHEEKERQRSADSSPTAKASVRGTAKGGASGGARGGGVDGYETGAATAAKGSNPFALLPEDDDDEEEEDQADADMVASSSGPPGATHKPGPARAATADECRGSKEAEVEVGEAEDGRTFGGARKAVGRAIATFSIAAAGLSTLRVALTFSETPIGAKSSSRGGEPWSNTTTEEEREVSARIDAFILVCAPPHASHLLSRPAP